MADIGHDDWVRALARCRDQGQPAVLVTVLEVRGHAPRDAGAKMLVGREESWGSVGGGNLEITAVQRARQLLDSPASGPEIVELGLTEHAPAEHGRQCCGGQVRLLLDPLPARAVVAVFGLGHVGQELARILCRQDLRLVLVDSRSEYAAAVADLDAGQADVVVRHEPVPEVVLGELPEGAHLLVMTHDHAEDIALCDQALRRGAWGSLGLIGSSAKWARFQRRLRQEGHEAATVARIRCPIGVAGAVGKEPAAIAVSVAAEILQLVQASRQQTAGAGTTAARRTTPGIAGLVR